MVLIAALVGAQRRQVDVRRVEIVRPEHHGGAGLVPPDHAACAGRLAVALHAHCAAALKNGTFCILLYLVANWKF